MKRFVVLAVVASLGFAGEAISQAAPAPMSLPADTIIGMRRAGMSLTGGVTDAMKAGIAAGSETKPFEEGAEGLVKWGKVYTSLFPEGTQTGMNTKAKPEIWSDRAGFEKANAAFIAASEKLYEAVKSGDKAAFAAAFTEEG